MFSFKSTMLRYSFKGEKTGWTFVCVPEDIIVKLKLHNKKGFRIRGVIDDVKFEKLSTYPVGEGRLLLMAHSKRSWEKMKGQW